ncbi:MAG: hypothetical protein FWB79_03490 [Treponema sp.]|nr:hypothetical protein [Treponema sp.]
MEAEGLEHAEEITEVEHGQAGNRASREWTEAEEQDILRQEALRREALRQKALRQEILRKGLLKSELEHEQARAASKRLEKEKKRRKAGVLLMLLGIGVFLAFFLFLGSFDYMLGYVLGIFPLACVIVGAWVWSGGRPKY